MERSVGRGSGGWIVEVKETERGDANKYIWSGSGLKSWIALARQSRIGMPVGHIWTGFRTSGVQFRQVGKAQNQRVCGVKYDTGCCVMEGS